MYINSEFFIENYLLLRPSVNTNDDPTAKRKTNIERTSGLMYLLGVDKVQKSRSEDILEIHSDNQVKNQFVTAVSELLVMGTNDAGLEYQATNLGKIVTAPKKINDRTKTNFLSQQVLRAARGNAQSYPGRNASVPLLNLGVGTNGTGVNKHADWATNIILYINFRQCGQDTFPLIVFLLRDTSLLNNQPDPVTVLREGLQRQFTDEMVEFLIANADFSGFRLDELTDQTLEIDELLPELFDNQGDGIVPLQNPSDNNYLECTIGDDVPRNRIIYGAPGTGKSFHLQELVDEQFKHESLWERITFHSNYTYGQFVGTYKPTPLYKNTGIKVFFSDKMTETPDQLEPVIDYQFVPGAFLSMLVKAIRNPQSSFVLLIEEINRADTAGVFGDVFQLLDRDKDGGSEYAITFNPDVMTYLKSEGITEDKIKLPSNFFIWATMNSADQGVAPMDTAFKRRWSFEYLSLNKNASKATGNIHLPFMKGTAVSWNKLREVINIHLKDLVPEDKLIGPFFLKTHELNDKDVFKNKLLLYLRDDVLRHNPNKLFIKKLFSDIVEDFDKDEEIFIFSKDELKSDEVTGDEVTSDAVTSDEVTGDEVTGDEVRSDE